MSTALVLIAALAGPAPVAFAAVGPTPQATKAGAMAWSAVKTNGGGWVTGLVVGPGGEVYARSDVGGAYRWDERARAWQQMLTGTGVPSPSGTDYQVESIATAPRNGKVVYAAVGGDVARPRGRVLRSADAGRTWKDGGARLPIDGNAEWRWGGERLAVDPANPDVVLFGSRTNGVLRTTDGGATWTRLRAGAGSPAGPSPAGVSFTLFDPSSRVVAGLTQGVWIGVQDLGVLHSADAGRTWRLVHPISKGVPRDAELAADGKLYVAVHGTPSRVLRIDTRTQAVTDVSPASGASFAMVAVDPLRPSRIIVGDDGVRDGKLWRSTNAGASWTALDVALSARETSRWATTADIDQWMSGGALAFDPTRPGSLWFAEGMGVWRSTDLSDAEVTWQFESDGIEELVSSAGIKPVGRPLVTASWDRGLMRHPNPTVGGATLPHRRQFGSAWDLAASPTDPAFLVAVLDDHQDVTGRRYPERRASGYSVDGGATWRRFTALQRGTAPADLLFGNIAVSAGNNDNLVWVPSTADAPKTYYTKDRGASWSPGRMIGASAGDYLHPAYYLRREGLAADPAVPGTFLALGGNQRTGSAALWKTVDGGVTWNKMTATGLDRPDYWDFRYNSHLVAVPGQPGLLFALAGRTDDGQRPFWRSVDGGRSWTEQRTVLDAHALAVGAPLQRGGPPTLFTYGTVGKQRGLFRSSDRGLSWVFASKYPRDWYQDITVLAGDPEVPGKVYVGFVGGGFAVGWPTTVAATTGRSMLVRSASGTRARTRAVQQHVLRGGR